MHAYIKVAVIK